MPTGHDPARRPLAELAIKAFHAQTWPYRELLILNQGEPFGLNHPQIREFGVLCPGNKYHSVGYLRNLGLTKAKGDYITSWDDDDYHHPSRMSLQAQPLCKDDIVASVLRCYTVIDLTEGGPIFGRTCESFKCGGCCGTIMIKAGLDYRYNESMKRGSDADFANQIPPDSIYPVYNEPQIYQRMFTGHNLNDRGQIVSTPRKADWVRLSDEARKEAEYTRNRYRQAIGI
jgi:glycosyltransferase involved in cell wall biosynthesis